MARGRITVLAAGVVAAGAAGASLGTGAAMAGRLASAPLRIHAASLAQEGQQLVWRLRADEPLRPASLATEGRSLCLLRERAGSGRIVGELCLTASHRGRPELVWAARQGSGYGVPQAVPASVSRSTPQELTIAFLPAAMRAGYSDLRWQVESSLTAAACSPVTGAECRQRYPRRPALARVHVPQLVGCVPRGPSYVTNGPRNVHEIALTFDDGPWPDMPQFVALLEREHVPATFFQIGEQISQYGAIDRRILADGDLIGDHTWDHADVAGGGAFAAGELARARTAIRARTGFTPCLFRAPYGAVGSGLISIARSMGMLTIEWDVDPRDWSRPGTGSITATVLGTTHNGSIVLQHDGGGNRSETLAALRTEIATFKRRGYRFVTVAGLLGLPLIYK